MFHTTFGLFLNEPFKVKFKNIEKQPLKFLVLFCKQLFN